MKRASIAGVVLVIGAAAAGHAMRRQAGAGVAAARARVEEAGANMRGPAHAKVKVALFGSLGSPATQTAEAALRHLQQSADGVGVQLIWKDLPSGAEAELAARAARAAGAQGKFWALHDRLAAARQSMTPELVDWAAEQVGIERDQFQRELESSVVGRAIEADTREAARLGVTSEGTVLINGRLSSVESLREVVKEERARADRLLASGVSWSRLQDELSAH